MWGSNPRVPEPQSGVLTTSPIPPYALIEYQTFRQKSRNTLHIKRNKIFTRNII